MHRLGIEASNLTRGGGITHLREILRAVDPRHFDFSSVTVWGGAATLSELSPAEWLRLRPVEGVHNSIARRALWQRSSLTQELSRDVDILFVPGGAYSGSFRPFVTMSRNMLPFEPRERRRFGLSSFMFWKLLLLEQVQKRTMSRAEGLIFLNEYARRVVGMKLPRWPRYVTTIPHGVDDSLRVMPRPQRDLADCSDAHPFRLLYVSILYVYKQQGNVAMAVAELRRRGYPVTIEFQGPADPEELERFERVRRRIDPQGSFLIYKGAVPHHKLRDSYASADAFVFASSCENMPNILVEAMAAGCAIASSDRGPMPEILGDAGCYFDPEDVAGIVGVLQQFLRDPEQRRVWAEAAYERAQRFSWHACAEATFAFLADVAAGKGRSR